MIIFSSAYNGIGVDSSGTIDEVPLNSYLREIWMDRTGVFIMDTSGVWGVIKAGDTPYPTNIQLYNYLYPYTQINKPQTEKIEISDMVLRNCFTSPIQLLSAPGDGLIRLPISLGYMNRFGSIAFDFANDLFVHCSTKTSADALFSIDNSIINAGATRSQFLGAIIPPGVSNDDAFVQNDSIVLSSAANATQGDGYLTLYLTYTTVEEAWYDGVYT